MAKLTCRSCRAMLTSPGARCQSCGWAADYGLDGERKRRERIIATTMVAIGLAMVIAIALAATYMRSL